MDLIRRHKDWRQFGSSWHNWQITKILEGVPKHFVAQTKGDILGDFDHTHPCGGGG